MLPSLAACDCRPPACLDLQEGVGLQMSACFPVRLVVVCPPFLQGTVVGTWIQNLCKYLLWWGLLWWNFHFLRWWFLRCGFLGLCHPILFTSAQFSFSQLIHEFSANGCHGKTLWTGKQLTVQETSLRLKKTQWSGGCNSCLWLGKKNKHSWNHSKIAKQAG